MPIDNSGKNDRGARPLRHDPGPNGTIFRVVEIPPESTTSAIDAKAAFEHLGSENKPRAEDSAKHQSMHKTNSIDYLVVLLGEMSMVMEDGEVLLKTGDCIVQRGTNHAWVNKSGKPCVLAAILIDGVPAP
jgi:mannose-6-phosphate isomerase-like protein (cupin superfamily)